MLLEMDLETTIYVTGIAVVFLQSMYFDYRMRQVHKKLDKVTEELSELRHMELIRRKEMGGQS
jgi:hypothetical protein